MEQSLQRLQNMTSLLGRKKKNASLKWSIFTAGSGKAFVIIHPSLLNLFTLKKANQTSVTTDKHIKVAMHDATNPISLEFGLGAFFLNFPPLY